MHLMAGFALNHVELVFGRAASTTAISLWLAFASIGIASTEAKWIRRNDAERRSPNIL